MTWPSRRRALLLGGSLLLGLLVTWLSWRALIVPYAERLIERATGHRATVGSLYPGLTTIRARDVVLMGAPPFQTATMVVAAEVDVQLELPSWRPVKVDARRVKVTYLRVGALDNLRGTAASRPAGGQSRAGGGRPTLSVREGRIEGFVRTRNDGGTFSLRTGPVRLDLTPEGGLSGVATDVVVSRDGWGTLSAAQAMLGARGDQRSLTISGARLAAADAGAAPLGPFTGGATSAAGKLHLWARSQEGMAGTVTAWGERSRGGDSRGRLVAAALPLGALGGLVAPLGLDVTGGRFDGELTLEREDSAPLAITGSVVVSGLSLAHPRLDRQPWAGLGVKASGLVNIGMNGGRLVVDELRVEALGLPLVIHGFNERQPVARGRWRIETARTVDCGPLLSAQPAPVRQALAGLSLDGDLGFRLAVAYDGAAWERTELDVDVAPLCGAQSEPQALQALLAGAAPEGGRPGHGWPLHGDHPDFVPLGALPPWLPGAFLTAEDARFFDHRGFDLENIRRALAHDLEVGDFARGASTITQQLAKNLFLGPERTLGRKLAEVVLAWRLQQRLSKQRTLELYLNILELGPGIRGVKRASEVYFGKPVTTLSPLEAAHLAALTPNPSGFGRRFRDGRVDEGWLRKLYDLLSMMKRSGRLSAAELAAARRSSLTLRPF